MSKPTRWSRPACFHEAGECVARWYLGFETDFSQVFSSYGNFDVTVGKEESKSYLCCGRTDGPEIAFPEPRAIHVDLSNAIVAAHVHVGEVYAEMALITFTAGVVAEARVRHASVTSIFPASVSERELADQVIDRWLLGRKEALDIAIERASAMMLAAPTWWAVQRLAERMQRHGSVVGSEIDTLCEFAFGREKPFTQDWTRLWPVEKILFRKGFLPEDPTTSVHAGPALAPFGARPN